MKTDLPSFQNYHLTTTEAAHSAYMPISLEQNEWRRRESKIGPICELTACKHKQADGIADGTTDAGARSSAVATGPARSIRERQLPHSYHRSGSIMRSGEGRAYIAAPALSLHGSSGLAALAMALSGCSGADAGWAALSLVGAVLVAAVAARLQARAADRLRCAVLEDLRRFGPCDGGDLLSIWPRRISIEQLDALMLDLERQSLVTRQPSAIDPVWRDLWRLTEGGKRVAVRLASGGLAGFVALLLLTACATTVGSELTYFRDDRTGLCFAGLHMRSSAQTMSWCPCTAPVLSLIPLGVEATSPRDKPVPAIAMGGAR